MQKRIIISILILLAIIWGIVIYKLSDMNTNNSNGKSTRIISMFIEDTLEFTNEFGITSSTPSDSKLEHASQLLNSPLRKVAHASVYFIFAFFIILIINLLFSNQKYAASFLITISLTIIFASLDEFHQTFVDGRTGQLMDVFIDNIGAICGCLFYTTYYIAYMIGKKSKKMNIEAKK